MDVGALDSTIDPNNIVGDGVAVVAQASTTSEAHGGKAATACLAAVVLGRDADRAALSKFLTQWPQPVVQVALDC